MSTFEAAKTIFQMRQGRVSNLSLQKLLYLAHMIHLGNHSKPLASNSFEAWDYGPVEPSLYRKLKAYGANEISDIFPAFPYGEDTPEHESISLVMDQLQNASPRHLVAVTHWEGGAWAKCYMPGIRGIPIPDRLILEEFHARTQSSEQRESESA